jgi:hypothetical protein
MKPWNLETLKPLYSGSTGVHQFSARDRAPIVLWATTQKMQTTQNATLLAVERNKVNAVVSGLHLIRHVQRLNSSTFIQTQGHMSGTMAAKPKIFRPFWIIGLRLRIGFQAEQSALL